MSGEVFLKSYLCARESEGHRGLLLSSWQLCSVATRVSWGSERSGCHLKSSDLQSGFHVEVPSTQKCAVKKCGLQTLFVLGPPTYKQLLSMPLQELF